ncbi:unnamed protein product [Mytilus edulis]|uniref:Uncharacterized protein n=1 Tax=Mytilus edulis TaxID=6550 RepID=A0A8S3VBY8_MYTED|nr:unnamed protein product [Mytilus edulis]
MYKKTRCIHTYSTDVVVHTHRSSQKINAQHTNQYSTGAAEGIVSYIRLALDNELRRHDWYEPIELMDGLGKLAVNDINKRKIVDAGALPLLLRILKQDNIEEQAVASKALWTLSFDKDVAQKIRDFANLMPLLEKLSGSQDKNVEKNCKGALFVLKGENDVKNRKYIVLTVL